MPKIDLSRVEKRLETVYPEPFDAAVRGRVKQKLGDAAGLSDFGVNLVVLKPGSASSQRHWHSEEDEFVYVISGEVTLIEDNGECVLHAGDAAGFAKNSGDGHQLVNKSDTDAVYLEIGSRVAGDSVVYSDIDMLLPNRNRPGYRFIHKDGTPYPQTKKG